MRPPAPSGALLALLFAVSPAFSATHTDPGVPRGSAGSPAAFIPLTAPMAASALTSFQSFLTSPAGGVALNEIPQLEAVMRLDPRSPAHLQALGPLAARLPRDVLQGGNSMSPAKIGNQVARAYLASVGTATAELELRTRAALQNVPDGQEGAAYLDRTAREFSGYALYGEAAYRHVQVLEAAARRARALGHGRALADAILADLAVPDEFTAHPGKMMPRGWTLERHASSAPESTPAGESVLARLGKGSSGIVYEHPDMQGAILKIFHLKLDKDFAAMLARTDVQTTLELSEAGVGPRLLEIRVELTPPMLSKERVYGDSLGHLIQSGRYGLPEHALMMEMLNRMAEARLMSDDMRGPNIIIGRTLKDKKTRAYFVDGGNLKRFGPVRTTSSIREALYTQPITVARYHDQQGRLVSRVRPFNHYLEQGLVRSGQAPWWLWAKTVAVEATYARHDPMPASGQEEYERTTALPNLPTFAGSTTLSQWEPSIMARDDAQELAELRLTSLSLGPEGWTHDGRALEPQAGNDRTFQVFTHPDVPTTSIKILPPAMTEEEAADEVSAARAIAVAEAGPRDWGGAVASHRFVRVRDAVRGKTMAAMQSEGSFGDDELRMVLGMLGRLARAGIRVDGIEPNDIMIGFSRMRQSRHAWLINAPRAAPFEPRWGHRTRVEMMMDSPNLSYASNLRDALYDRNGIPRHWSWWRRLWHRVRREKDPIP